MDKNTKWTQDDEKLFDELYKAVIKKKNEFFRLQKKRIELTLKHTVGTLGADEEIKYLEEELTKVKDRVFKGPQATHVIEKLTKAKFREIIKNSKLTMLELYHDVNWLERHIESLAGQYLSPHMFEYLISRITEIKNSSSSQKKPQKNNALDITSMVWSQSQAKLKVLYKSLIKEQIIAEIEYSTFAKHFEGYPTEPPINFLLKKGYVFYLLDKLTKYIHSGFYTGDNDTSSATTVGKHFVFHGKRTKNLHSVKCKGINPKNNIIKKRIDNIINSLSH
ncbi:hypothetical protein [Botryobacter ruber]|uniref:hypothetical protein n=1 Tax=Botryobacter ruber TaxID=2171629 RepID=UPI000E0C91A4|nr:hypothetical protein [Botryobacter ruber]